MRPLALNAMLTFGIYPITLFDNYAKLILFTIIPAALLLAVYLAYALPPSYRSSATILLEALSIPPELVQVTPTSYADEQIELVSRRVLTTERLEKVVQELDPYPDRPDLSTKEKAVQVVADTIIERVDPITLEVLKQSSAFSIHYHNADPRRAQQVVKRIADLFLEYNRATRAERASETYNFLLEQKKATLITSSGRTEWLRSTGRQW